MNSIRRTRVKARAEGRRVTQFRSGHAIIALAVACVLAACASSPPRSPVDIAGNAAFVEAAAGDAEETARLARLFNGSNNWGRASDMVRQAEYILAEALVARDRIRTAHAVAAAKAAARPGANNAGRPSPALSSAAQLLIGTALADADRNIAAIERTVTELRQLNVPGAR